MSERTLGKTDLDAAVLGGLLLSSGGSGMSSAVRHRRLGEEALALGEVRLVSMDDFADDDQLVVATAVGAPGTSGSRTQPADSVAAAHAIEAACGRRLSAAMVAHVPGLYAWTIAAGLGIALADAGTNGRAHPTERMGGMGLASNPDATVWQAAHAAGGGGEPPLSVLAHGHPNRTSHVLRAASVQNGGLINAARGPFSAAFVRENGAPGAISFALALGAAMLAVSGTARIAAAARQLGGELLIEGEVVENTVSYAAGFDTGTVAIASGSRRVALGVYNEFMTADEAGKRICTFPDFLGSLDAKTGDPVSIAALKPGARVAVVQAPRSRIPLGAGVFDRAVYAEVEAAMGCELTPYVFT